MRRVVFLRPLRYSVLYTLTALVLLSGSFSSALDEARLELPRFDSDVLPIFQASCLVCHGENLQQNGLDLRTRDRVLKGGESGPAIVPGSAAGSLIFEMVSSGKMPLGGQKLSTQEIELIRRWIEAGGLKEGEEPETVKKQQVAERDIILTIFHPKCISCHGKWKQEAGLDLRTRAGLLKGGKSGPAIVLGKPEESLLVKLVVSRDMPPQTDRYTRPLRVGEVEKLRQWIAAGAPAGPDEILEVGGGPDPLVSAEKRKFWSFQPPERPRVPHVRQKQLVRNPIDAFLLRKLEAKNLSFSPEAENLTLMRRAYFDLIGLPPEPEEVEAYLKDDSPEAYERMVERLMASPRYGERWARYWLDAAGFAESQGKIDRDTLRPHAWRYRDYVIRSLNADKPYDQFLLEQIAGDELFDYKATEELTPEQRDYLVATGFLRTAGDDTDEAGFNFVPYRMAVLADQVNIFSSAVMGLTMQCARCHSHKYDPLPQRDYYRFQAIFQTAYDPYDWLIPSTVQYPLDINQDIPPHRQRYLPYAPQQERREVEAHNAPIKEKIEGLERSLEQKAKPLREKLVEEKLAHLPEGVREDLRKALETPEEKRSGIEKYLVKKFKPSVEVKRKELKARSEDFKASAEEIEKAIKEAEEQLKPEPKIRALFDVGGEPSPTHVFRRGEPKNPGPRVEPGVPSALRDGIAPYKVIKPPWTTDTSGRRQALARWLIQPKHPLTARVIVNRVWQHHFEKGMVVTPGNFGQTGARPTHPKLLDWLATEFVRRGWSLKTIHKLIMTSAAYRQSSRFDGAVHGEDPDNVLLSRFPLRRLDGEAIRDSILKVTGRLDPRPFGLPDGVEVTPKGEVVSKASKAGFRRSIYVLQRRSTPLTLLTLFDAPRMEPHSLKRALSTVPTQALQLSNSDMVRESSRYFAGRVMDTADEDLSKQIERVYLTALSRWPTAEEGKLGKETVQDSMRYWLEHLEEEVPAEPKRDKARWLALATFCHTILNSAEFIYID